MVSRFSQDDEVARFLYTEATGVRGTNQMGNRLANRVESCLSVSERTSRTQPLRLNRRE